MPSLKLFVKSLKNLGRCATSSFPAIREPPPPGFRGSPEVSGDCMGCRACAEQCPSGAIQAAASDSDSDTAHKSGGRQSVLLTVEVARCLFCGRCQEVCPKNAVKLSGGYDFATQDLSRIDLREVDLAGCSLCKRPFATGSQLDWVASRLIERVDPSVRDAVRADLQVYQTLCPDCRCALSIRLNTHTEKYV